MNCKPFLCHNSFIRTNKISQNNKASLFTIIKNITEYPDSIEFREPLDLEIIKDYTNAIKKPIDLSTCLKKLERDKYEYVEECLNDLQLIWDNCR